LIEFGDIVLHARIWSMEPNRYLYQPPSLICLQQQWFARKMPPGSCRFWRDAISGCCSMTSMMW
jgi:hypothetical protein